MVHFNYKHLSYVESWGCELSVDTEAYGYNNSINLQQC
jgi:hypothetical protein